MLSLRHLRRRFGSVEVLRDLSLEVAAGEWCCLVGPSGCGKTTTLRLVAGLEQPDEGGIALDGREATGTPAHERPVAMVFQHPALWPHRTVADNVGYGLEVRGLPREERQRRVAAALEKVRLEEMGGRSPGQLSGGEQQRVALARALAVRPQVLLLDEPFSHLDPPLRRELRSEIRQIHRETRLTVLQVTHDPQEALSLADRVGVIQEGVMAQVADPRMIYRRPDCRAVAEFFGEIHWIEGAVTGDDAAGFHVKTALGTFRVEPAGGTGCPATGWLGFRPALLRPGTAGPNSFPATVGGVAFLGVVEEWELDVPGGHRWRAHRAPGTHGDLTGSVMSFSVSPSDLVWVRRD